MKDVTGSLQQRGTKRQIKGYFMGLKLDKTIGLELYFYNKERYKTELLNFKMTIF